MREKNNLSDVPEEDLNQHDSFIPAIGESGRIRPFSKSSEEDSGRVAFLQPPTLTRLDTVQDLVIERKAEPKKTEDKPASQENLPQDLAQPELPQQEPQEKLPPELPEQNLPQERVPSRGATVPSKPAPKIPFWKRLFGKKKTEPVMPKESIPPQEAVPEPVSPVVSPEDAVESVPHHVPETVAEPEHIHLSGKEIFPLETPLSQMNVTDKERSVSQPSASPAEQVVQDPMSVSLEDVSAHPFTDSSLTEALPPTISPAAVQPEVVSEQQPEVALVSALEQDPNLETPIPQQSAQPTPETPTVEVPTDAVPQTPVVEKVAVQPEEVSPVIPPIAPPTVQELAPISQEPSQASKEEPPQQMSPQTPEQPPKRKKRHWLWVLLAVLIVFFGIIGGVVPVENIPVLRSIAHAMGFTPDEAKQMSFLRALLTWTDKTLGLNGKLSAGPTRGESALFAGRLGRTAGGTEADVPESSQQNQMTRQTGKTSLFDMRALNELQRQKGRPLDQIAGTVLLQPGQKADTRAAMRDTNVNVQTEANRDKSEVYFGSDASATNREFYDGYDSVKTLKKIANPHIADGQAIDWLMQMTSRMMKADTGLVSMDKELGTSVVGWQTNTQDVGEHKAQKDLYHAWITSRMSNYTTSIMLKKTLADSSFLNAAIPTQASDSLIFGGVRIDTDSLDSDQEGWKEYLEWERKCKEELMGAAGGGKMVEGAVKVFNNLFEETNFSGNPTPPNVNFPSSCQEIVAHPAYTGSKFEDTMKSIRNACYDMQKGYERLVDRCNMAVNLKGRCDNYRDVRTYYQSRYDDFFTYCKNKYCEDQKQDYLHNGGVEADWDCATKAPKPLQQWATDKGESYKESCNNGSCFQTQSTSDVIKSDLGATSDYFPQITKGNKTEGSNEAQEYEKATENVKTSIIEGFQQNSVRKNL